MASCFIAFLKNRDNFGTPVQLNFKGKVTHTTWPGAIITILTRLVVLSYVVVKLDILVNKKEPEALQYTV